MQHRENKRVIPGIFISAATVVLAGLLWAAPFGAVAAASSDTLVVGLVAEPVTFDPPQVTDLNTARAVRRVYEGLTGFIPGTYDIEPALAESWEISDDGTVYTFKLRQGVKFHDGSPFNAEAVKYSMERQIDADHPAHASGKYPFAKNYLGNVAAIDAVDSHTVKFTLKEPFAPFLQYLTHLSIRIVSPKALQDWGADIATHPAGTGPYKLAEWQPGVKAVFEANEDYWDGAPSVKKLIFVPIVEAQARLSAITTGEIDLTYDVPAESLDALRTDTNVAVLEGLSAHVWYFVLNTRLENPPFNKKLVRQAMNYAVDKEAIVKNILQGTGVAAYTPLSPVYGKTHNKDVRRYDYDPAKAKELLAEAGYPDGFECKFLVPVSGSGMQSPVDMGTYIQANLAAVGIRCEIQTMEWGAYLAEYRNSPQMAAMSWNSTVGDPDYVLYRLFHSSAFPPAWNAGWYKSAKVDAMLGDARKKSDPDLRLQLYRDAQKLIVEDAPWIFVDHGSQIVVHNKRVKGFVLSPNFDFKFKKVTVE